MAGNGERRYGESREAPGGVIADVREGTAAARAGLTAGDTILEADGEPLTDVLGWEWAAADDEVEVRVRASDGSEREAALVRAPGEPWGLSFGELVFDGVRECVNACAFCFVSQLPAGLRAPLYVRDDDYRLSFLLGNFITLTNLAEADVERIVRLRLTPLHVSVHAVTPEVRRRLVCPTGEDTALETLDRLLAEGIEAHTQIVLVPGANDGEEMERTLGWLAEREGVRSVGIVPVGRTAHQERIARGYEAPEDAREVLERVHARQRGMRDERGVGWVYAADEFYLASGEPIPPAGDYDGFPQYENGIGMVRDFLDGMAEEAGCLADDVEGAPWPKEAVLVTGELFAPVMAASVAEAVPGAGVRVLPVPNALFGGNVSVAGLLAGRDIAEGVRRDAEAEGANGQSGTSAVYLVPDIVLNSEGLTLDGMCAADLGAASGADVRLVSSDPAGLAEAFRELAFGGGTSS